MVVTLLLTMLFARIKGNKLRPLLRAYDLYPVYAFELFGIFLQINIFLQNYTFVKWAEIIKPFYMALYLFPIIRRQLFKEGVLGSCFIFAGTFLNKLVIYANNGKMPIYPTLSRFTGYYDPVMFAQNAGIHILGGPTTKLAFLSDYIDVGYSILSIGDLLIRVFVVIILYHTIIRLQEKTNVGK